MAYPNRQKIIRWKLTRNALKIPGKYPEIVVGISTDLSKTEQNWHLKVVQTAMDVVYCIVEVDFRDLIFVTCFRRHSVDRKGCAG